MLCKKCFECGDTIRISTRDKITGSGMIGDVGLLIFVETFEREKG